MWLEVFVSCIVILISFVPCASAQFFSTSTSATTAADVGVCVGSSAAAKLLSRYVQSTLRQPRLVQMNLMSGVQPWFDAVAQVESRNTIALGQLKTSFRDNQIEAEFRNVTLKSSSNFYLLPLPFFLGKDTTRITAEISRASLKLRTLRDIDYVQLDGCIVDVTDIDVRLDNSPFLNMVLNPLHHYLLPASLIRDAACNAVEDSLLKLRRRFAIEIPLVTIIPSKFTPYLITANVSLFLELEAINADNDQLTVSASIEWTESATAANVAAVGSSITSSLPSHSFFDIDPNVQIKQNEATLQNEDTLRIVHQMPEKNTIAEKLKIWVRDTLINELFEHFHWNFQWMEEQIPVESPKLPQSTRNFLSTLCTNCYFLLRVSANGSPHVEVANSSIILKKSDQIFMKVVNPTRNVDAVFVNFALGLSVRLTPKIEAGIFRTQVDLLDTDIRMQEGAFPPGWITFIQDLVRGMIIDVIWPNLKKEIEFLSYSDGMQIPIYCGLEPVTAQLHFDENRIGASAALHLDDASLSQCIQQLKSKLPDPSKLLIIRDKRHDISTL